jgi:hypothetical protein
MNEKNQAENQVSHVIEESEKEIEWVKGDQVEISYSGVKNVRGMNIALRQAGAKTIVGDDLVVRQGGFFKGQADKLSMNQAAAAILQTNQAQATGSAMGIILAQGDVTVDQGMARVVVGRNAVNIDQGGAFLIISLQSYNQTKRNDLSPCLEGGGQCQHSLWNPRVTDLWNDSWFGGAALFTS